MPSLFPPVPMSRTIRLRSVMWCEGVATVPPSSMLMPLAVAC
jgi:hypothetical protein